MPCRAIAFMLVERVTRVFLPIMHHEPVTLNLSQYGSGADGGYLGIAFDNGLGENSKLWNMDTVHQYPFRRQIQAAYSPLHGQ